MTRVCNCCGNTWALLIFSSRTVAFMGTVGMGLPRRVLIASANPLFGKGLQKIFQERWGTQAVVVGLTGSMGETLQAMETLQPDLVIVDYDDRSMNRAEFLSHFVAGDRPMQVMLVSLRGGGSAVVYDRHTLTPSEAEDWLNVPKTIQPAPEPDDWLNVPKTTHTAPQPREIPRRSSMKHFVRLAVMVIVSTILVYLGLERSKILPDAASAQAIPIDGLFKLHYAAIAFLFSLITMFMLYSILVFRRKPGETGEGAHIRGNNRVEMVWTALPVLAVLVVSTIGARNLAEVIRPAQNEMVVNVTAGQWFWSYEYPETGVVSDSLYLPVNKPILLRMTSQDVIHSFWVPEFRVKQDVLPGENLVKELRITPILIGNFKNRCAELCGGAHAYMESPVVVTSQEDFDAWMQNQVQAVMDDPVARGNAISRQNGCAACHSIDGKAGVGPTWKGLYGEQQTLADGSTVTADDAYLHESIVDPQVKVVEGYAANVMPSVYKDSLTEEQIADIIEFIKSVK